MQGRRPAKIKTMKIEEKGKLEEFETLPKERTLYVTIVHYSNNYWTTGPCGFDKSQVLESLAIYTGVAAARIYSIEVPTKSLPAA